MSDPPGSENLGQKRFQSIGTQGVGGIDGGNGMPKSQYRKGLSIYYVRRKSIF